MAITKEDCPEFLNEFFFYLKIVKGLSDRTIEAYHIDLRLFLKYLLLNKHDYQAEDIEDVKINAFPVAYLEELTIKDIHEFLYFVSQERDNKANTRARKASSLKSFFKFMTSNLNGNPYLKNNPVKELEIPSIKKTQPKFLNLDDSLTLLDNIESKNGSRDYCIITLFLNCGMRLSELVNLNLNDVDFKERTLRLLGKGNKERIVYINDSCIEAIENYYNERKAIEDCSAMFVSSRNTRISKRRVQQIVEENLLKSGLSGRGLSTHKLRHTAATLMYQHGKVDVLVLKEILGHVSVSTTEIYTHVADEKKKDAVDSSPLSKVKIVNKKNNP